MRRSAPPAQSLPATSPIRSLRLSALLPCPTTQPGLSARADGIGHRRSACQEQPHPLPGSQSRRTATARPQSDKQQTGKNEQQPGNCPIHGESESGSVAFGDLTQCIGPGLCGLRLPLEADGCCLVALLPRFCRKLARQHHLVVQRADRLPKGILC